MFLDDILSEKRRQVKKDKLVVPQDKLLSQLEVIPKTRDFKKAISKLNQISLIAEIKKASPSRGIIQRDFCPLSIANVYQESGADAISVLTEEKFFKGKLYYINDIKKEVRLPILRKDFIVDEYQVYESAVAGSDAILLISQLLSKQKLASFTNIANKLKIDVIIEVHTKEDLEKALGIGTQIIGINNRNLQTFEVDITTTSRLIRLIPKDKIIISESGITNYKTIKYLKELGVNAVLIGEAFIKAGDINLKVREMMGLV